VAKAEQRAGHRVGRRAVRGTIVGHDPLHLRAERTVERDSPSKDRHGGHGLLVRQHLHVGYPGGVVDADVNELPPRPSDILAAVSVDTVTRADAHASNDRTPRFPVEFP
jgi:hypothetical protein